MSFSSCVALSFRSNNEELLTDTLNPHVLPGREQQDAYKKDINLNNAIN